MTTENEMFHPCGCTDYNGGQCYNCLNGFHAGCDGNCDKKNPTEQPKSAEEIYRKHKNKLVGEIWGSGGKIKDSSLYIFEAMEEYATLREQSAKQRIKELEESILWHIGRDISLSEAHNKAVQECIGIYVKNTLDTNPVYSGLISQFENLKKR